MFGLQRIMARILGSRMTEVYKRALAFVLRWEGGYSNHPNDTGG